MTGKSQAKRCRIEAYEHRGVGTKINVKNFGITLIPRIMHPTWKRHWQEALFSLRENNTARYN